MRRDLKIALVTMIGTFAVTLMGVTLAPVVNSWFRDGPQLDAEAIAVPFVAPSKEWWQLSGAIYLRVVNNGALPATGVSLVVPGAMAYRRGPWTRGERARVYWSPLEDLEVTPNKGKIDLGNVAQGQTEYLVIWTEQDYLGRTPWSSVEDIVLRHDTGVDTVSVRIITGPVATWLDRYLFDGLMPALAMATLGLLGGIAFAMLSDRSGVRSAQKKLSAIDKKDDPEPKGTP